MIAELKNLEPGSSWWDLMKGEAYLIFMPGAFGSQMGGDGLCSIEMAESLLALRDKGYRQMAVCDDT